MDSHCASYNQEYRSQIYGLLAFFGRMVKWFKEKRQNNEARLLTSAMSLFATVRFVWTVFQNNLETHFAHSFLACDKREKKINLEVSLPTYKYFNWLAVLARTSWSQSIQLRWGFLQSHLWKTFTLEGNTLWLLTADLLMELFPAGMSAI